MAQTDVVVFNIATFISTLFLLEFGADKFIDHTAIVARRTGLSETVIGLLTVGGEWEELAVVVALLAQGRSSLAIGTIIGAVVSNILGAFSLGLLFYGRGQTVQFDRSSWIYSVVLLVLTTFATPVVYFPAHSVWLVCGAVLIITFGIYILLVGLAIGRGVLTAPENSDSDSSSDSDSDGNSDGDSISDAGSTVGVPETTSTDPITVVPNAGSSFVSNNDQENDEESTAPSTLPPVPSPSPRQGARHGLWYHSLYLVLGFLAICLAGYVLSQASTNITDQFGISDVLFGVIILAIATTLPEKFVAVMSGHRGHPGILVANCVGSNIFLLALCLGIIMVDTRGALDGGNVTIPELAVMWGTTLGLTLTVWLGASYCRWVGAMMLAGYVAFIVLEFTVIHGVAS